MLGLTGREKSVERIVNVIFVSSALVIAILFSASLLIEFNGEYLPVILGLQFLCILLLFAFMRSNLITPIKMLGSLFENLSKGKHIKSSYLNVNSEINRLSAFYIKISANIERASDFARKIGEGVFDQDTQFEKTDELGQALTDMKAKLERLAEEDKTRDWINVGLAEFSTFLRNATDSKEVIGSQLISRLVKFTGANQGKMYIAENDHEHEPFLELIGSYAWDRKKHLTEQIYPGQGLVGQAWQEQGMIYMTDIPKNYISITSGLGEATPTSIIILPLQAGNEIYGMIELAFFQRIADHKKEFLQKVSDAIGAALKNIRTTSQIQRHLQASRQSEEQLQAQEEELRQTMEEIAATQEEMVRKNAEVEKLLIASREKEVLLQQYLQESKSKEEQIAQLLKLHREEKEEKEAEVEMLLVQLRRNEQQLKEANLKLKNSIVINN